MGCDVIGVRGSGREAECLFPHWLCFGASSHPSPEQASPLGAAQRDSRPRATPKGYMEKAPSDLVPSALSLLHPTSSGMQGVASSTEILWNNHSPLFSGVLDKMTPQPLPQMVIMSQK